MKLEKDLNKYNKEELLDLIFSFVEEEAFEEKELEEMLNLSEEELKEVVKELIKIDEEICRMVNDEEDENKRIITLIPHGKKYEELCEAVLWYYL